MDKNDQCLLDIIEAHSGLQVRGTHLDCIHAYVQKRMDELHMDFTAYCRLLIDAPAELSLVIDEAAINETYFFREYRQFEYVRDRLFPEYAGRHMIIWSACCSTGEEPVSLAVLARSCGIDADIYASDIDVSALTVLRTGLYTQGAFRTDGSSFHHILDAYGSHEAGSYTINSEILNSIHVSEYNLAGTDPGPIPEESADLVFVRNVFIYFNKKTQDAVIGRLVRYLRPGGLLFFSMSEIAGIDVSRTELPLIKEHCGSVYFFRKVDPASFAVYHRGRHCSSGSEGSVPVERKIRKLPAEQRPAVTGTRRLSDTIPSEISVPGTDGIPLHVLGGQILAAVDRHDLGNACKLLSSCSCSPAELEYKFYYSAVIAKEEGKYGEAAELFLKASLLNTAFWPASLQLGLLYEQQGNEKKALKAFSECAKILEKYIEEQKTCYNFLVESFSPSYFYILCTVYIEKGKKHAV
jgi:chemotaxis protein methyltransferase CheR